MALIAKSTGKRGVALIGGHPVKQYDIYDRYKKRDTLVGSTWARTAEEALTLYRQSLQGKTD